MRPFFLRRCLPASGRAHRNRLDLREQLIALRQLQLANRTARHTCDDAVGAELQAHQRRRPGVLLDLLDLGRDDVEDRAVLWLAPAQADVVGAHPQPQAGAFWPCPARHPQIAAGEVQRREIDPTPLFAGIASTPDELQRGGDIGMQDFLHILRTGDQLLGNEPLGFILGQQLHVLAMGPVGVAIASAPNLRAGLQTLESFARLHASYVDIGARSTLRGMTVTILYQHDTGDVERFHTQTAMVLLQQYIEIMTGTRYDDVHFRLAIPEARNKAAYQEALHGQVTFDAGTNEIDIPHQ